MTAPGPLPAHAQPAPVVDKTKSKAARQYVDAGLTAQRTGDYDTAVVFYEKAYQLVPHPTLLFNMAQAHRLAGHLDKALELYTKYLATDPTGAQAATARELVAELTARKAEQDRLAEEARKAEDARKAEQDRLAEEARKAEQDRLAEDARKAEEARKAAPRARELEGAKPEPGSVAAQGARPRGSQPEPDAGRNLRWFGAGAGALGVASLAVGIGFGLHARTLSSEFSHPGTTYDRGKDDAGRTANRIAIAGGIGGGVLVAAGVVLYWRGAAQSRHTERVTLAPMVSDQVAGLVVVGALP